MLNQTVIKRKANIMGMNRKVALSITVGEDDMERLRVIKERLGTDNTSKAIRLLLAKEAEEESETEKEKMDRILSTLEDLVRRQDECKRSE